MFHGTGEGNQEQSQIIATVIGKPTAKAPTIDDANATSKFTSGCTFSNSGMAYSTARKGKKPSLGRSGDGFSRTHTVFRKDL